MNHSPKEGALRPLQFPVPKNQPQPPTTPKNGACLAAALGSYPLAYLYIHGIWMADHDRFWRGGVLVFALLFVAGVEGLARAWKRRGVPHSGFWALCWLGQSAAMAVLGLHVEPLGPWQILVWHITAIYWVLCRTGMLAAGGTGSLLPLDGMAGVFLLPWGGFCLRGQTLWRALRDQRARRPAGSARRVVDAALSALLAVALAGVACTWLAAAEPHFAALVKDFGRLFDWHWVDASLVTYFVFSLPVGAWLYGLVANSLRRAAPPVPQARFYAWLATAPRLPAAAGVLVPGALCAVYALFFGVQVTVFAAALRAPGSISAPTAAQFAVDGFWELCRILLLDLTVLAVLYFFGATPLGQKGPRRALLTLFCTFGVAFALLAGAKLGAYIGLYGPTPRRVLSGWFLGVLLVWCLLAGLRLFFRLRAARIGVVALALSFTVLCCLPVEQFCVAQNLERYESGQTDAPDWELLRVCYYQSEALRKDVTVRLAEAGLAVQANAQGLW